MSGSQHPCHLLSSTLIPGNHYVQQSIKSKVNSSSSSNDSRVMPSSVSDMDLMYLMDGNATNTTFLTNSTAAAASGLSANG
mmetsp:Transcript_30522/g.22242  ORF Transcript_30522/g.22242 Transcript_30522/m.22242 type:complete len:81 (-) Transcript_30522:1268-1510(-)